MQTIDWDKSERFPQRRKAADGRLLHCCCICGHLGPWSHTWSYYGSFKDADDGVTLPKFCSETCKQKCGPNAEHATEEMKERAKAAEWREPNLVYRDATSAEKFNAAASRQRQQRKD